MHCDTGMQACERGSKVAVLDTIHGARVIAQKMVESGLDSIPGLGPARKQALIRHFGSLDRLKHADAAEIARVRGFGPALADKVFTELHR